MIPITVVPLNKSRFVGFKSAACDKVSNPLNCIIATIGTMTIAINMITPWKKSVNDTAKYPPKKVYAITIIATNNNPKW